MNDVLTLRVEHEVASLGPEWDLLFAAGPGLQSGRAWFAATIEAALPRGADPRLIALSDGAGPLALVPMLAGPGRSLGSLTTPYTCLYQPLFRSDAADAKVALAQIGRYCRHWPVTRFEALDPDWPGLALLRSSLSRAGLASRTFDHFGNWYEPVTSRSWEAYLQARPGALRETVRRKTRSALKSGLRVEIARSAVDVAGALAAYEVVYDRSWKQPEPFPDFNATLVRALGCTGSLRIGLLWKGTRPIAAQYWSVADGRATVLKLAHDEAFKGASPGTVLTAATIRELIEADGVRELDFGRGDDSYKKGWASVRRPRIGMLGVDPRTVAGLRTLAVHDGGFLVRGARAIMQKQGRSETSC